MHLTRSKERDGTELNGADDVPRFPFVADLLDVSLDQRVNLLDVDFAGFVVADLNFKRGRRNSIACRVNAHHGAYLRHRLPENLLVLFLRDVLLVVMRF